MSSMCYTNNEIYILESFLVHTCCIYFHRKHHQSLITISIHTTIFKIYSATTFLSFIKYPQIKHDKNIVENKKVKMQAVGLEPTRANTLRPERSTLDHSVTLASVSGIRMLYLYSTLPFFPFSNPSPPSLLLSPFLLTNTPNDTYMT